MKKIFYKLFILGGLIGATTSLHSSKTEKNNTPLTPNKIVQKITPPVSEKKTSVKEDDPSTQQKKPFDLFQKLTPFVQKARKKINFAKFQMPTKAEFAQFIDSQLKAFEEEEKTSRYNVIRQLMAPTYLLESTLCHMDDQKIVHSDPMHYFYFCSANALTIGYGLKIELNGKELAPEGIQALNALDLRVNGQPLTLDEKKELVSQCISVRDQYDEKHSPKLSRMRYDKQVDVLFPKGGAKISTENALYSAQIEYMDKLEKLLEKNPFLKNSFYTQALGADLAYQFGNTGVTRCSYFKKTKQGTMPSEISIGSGDRLKIRKFLCALARKHYCDKLKRKSAPPSPEEQNAFTLFAIQKYVDLFKTGIMQRNPYYILLMENMMTIVMMQHQQDIQNRPLLNLQLRDCQKQAHQLVYHHLFHSETICQLPRKLQPITMVDAVKSAEKKLSPWIKGSSLSLAPDAFMEKILLSEATKKVKLYNQRYKQSITLKTPSAKKTKIVTQSTEGR